MEGFTLSKKILFFCFSLFYVFSISAYAFEEETEGYAPTGICFDIEEISEEDEFAISPFALPSQSLEDYIVEKCMNHETTVNISAYSITPDEIDDKVMSVLMLHPELMAKNSIGYYVGSGIVTRIVINYFDATLEESNKSRELLDAEIDRYISYADSCPDKLGKLLIAHDKLVRDCVYEDYSTKNIEVSESDLQYNAADTEKKSPYVTVDNTKYYCFKYEGKWYYQTNDYISFHLYGIIKNKSAVCQGYSQMTYMIAKKLGFEVNYISSESMNHIWNCIKVDGKWYHIDTTWDDTWLGTAEDGNTHQFFLRSDADFMKQGENGSHYATDWVTYLPELPVCNSTLYESNHIFNFPYRGSVSYSDGEYKLNGIIKTNTGNLDLEFFSKALYSGPMLVTEPTEDENSFVEFYIFPLTDIDNVKMFAGVKKNGTFSSFIEENSGTRSANTLTQVQRNKTNYISSANEELSFMF